MISCSGINCSKRKISKRCCQKHYDALPEQINKKKLVRLNRKIQCIYYYSNGNMKCSCCGETIIGFLTINHDKNDGAEHRRKIFNGNVYKMGGGNSFYMWLIRNDFPEGFSVQCWNCNSGSFYNNGICPHKTSFRGFRSKNDL